MSWAIKGMKTIQQSAFQSMASQQQYTCPLAILRGSEPVQDLTPADSSLTPFIGARVLRVAPSALLTLHRTQSEHPHSPKSLWALINASVHELYTIALKFSLEHYPQLKKKKHPKPTSEVTLVVLRKLLILYTNARNCASIPHKSAVWFPFLLLSEHTPRKASSRKRADWVPTPGYSPGQTVGSRQWGVDSWCSLHSFTTQNPSQQRTRLPPKMAVFPPPLP